MNLIALKNFKSYDHQLVNNLSPHINVILGKNGDGKSNFFKGTTALIQPSTSSSPIRSTTTKPNTTRICTYIPADLEKPQQRPRIHRSRDLLSQPHQQGRLRYQFLQNREDLEARRFGGTADRREDFLEARIRTLLIKSRLKLLKFLQHHPAG